MIATCFGSESSSGVVERVSEMISDFTQGLKGKPFLRTDDPDAVKSMAECIQQLIGQLEGAFRIGTQMKPSERIQKAKALVAKAEKVLKMLKPLNELKAVSGPRPVGIVRQLLELEKPIHNLDSIVEIVKAKIEFFPSDN